MSNYWQQRERDRLYNQQLAIAEKALAKEYQRCIKEIKIKLLDLYDEIFDAYDDGTILISDLYKYNRYYDLVNNLNANLIRLGEKEIAITEDALRTLYNLNSASISQELGFNPTVNDDAVKNAINSIWCGDGKHWSNRVWTNKSALQDLIQKGMVDCIARGVSRKEVVSQLMKDVGVGFHQADRLVRTELTYIQNKSCLDKYAEAGVEKYRYLAAHDERTSDICKDLDGKVFLLKDASVGTNYPPMHPNCRSTVLAVL